MKINSSDSLQPYFIASASVFLLFVVAIGILFWRASLVVSNGDVSFFFTEPLNPRAPNGIYVDVSSHIITTSIGTATMLLFVSIAFSLLIVNGLVYVLSRIPRTNGWNPSIPKNCRIRSQCQHNDVKLKKCISTETETIEWNDKLESYNQTLHYCLSLFVRFGYQLRFRRLPMSLILATFNQSKWKETLLQN